MEQLKHTMLAVKTALENLEVKATKENCRSLSTCHYLLDKVIAACDNIKKDVNENDGNGEGENVPG